MSNAIRIGVSACILGREVRHDGGHKRDDFVREVVARFAELVPVCPEVEAGMGVPRPAVRLVRIGEMTRMIDPKSGADHTAAMTALAERRVSELSGVELCGFIVMKGSPSCGMERVKLHGEEGSMPAREGRGLFTAELMRRLPDLPVEESGRLNDPALRESFFDRVFAYRRLRDLFGRPWAMRDLIALHAGEKLLILAHDRVAYQQLGRLVAAAAGRDPAEVAADYQRLMLAGLRRPTTPGRHVNVLQHMAGYLKDLLDEADHAELHQAIDELGRGLVPLIVPVTLLRHHIRRHGIDYLAQQSYLQPHPRELTVLGR